MKNSPPSLNGRLGAAQSQLDQAIGRKRIAIDLAFLIAVRRDHGIACTILTLKRDFSKLRKTSQKALPHLIDKVLDRLTHKLVEDSLNEITYLLSRNIMSVIWSK